MSIVERLHGIETEGPDVDADAVLRRVRRRVRQRRRTQLAGVVVSALAVCVTALVLVTRADSEAQVDTAGPVPVTPAQPYLPTAVPEGFALAWVDIHSTDDPPTETEHWTEAATDAYVLGYRFGHLELEARVYPGLELEVGPVVRAWGPRTEVVADEAGRRVISDGPVGDARVLIEFDGGVVQVSRQPLRDRAAPLPFGSVVAFGRSFRALEGSAWRSAIAGADVAPPIGIRGSETLVVGEGWRLDGLRYRRPRAVTGPALAVRFEEPAATVRDAGPRSFGPRDADEQFTLEIARNGDEQFVAWGVAPATATSVRLRFTGGTVIAPAVTFGEVTAFAVDVGAVDEGPRLVEALDESGRVLSSIEDESQGPCVATGADTVVVPDVVGMGLWEAIRAIDAAGLTVIGTGTSGDDPRGDEAVVTSQAPDDPQRVPAGSCVGFRTR